MQGKLTRVDSGWAVKYFDEQGCVKTLPLIDKVNEMYANPFIEFPHGGEDPVYDGKSVEFETVLTLKEGSTFTVTEGWNGDPIEGEYAKIIFTKTVTDQEIEKWAYSTYHVYENSPWFEPLMIGAKWMRERLNRTK